MMKGPGTICIFRETTQITISKSEKEMAEKVCSQDIQNNNCPDEV